MKEVHDSIDDTPLVCFSCSSVLSMASGVGGNYWGCANITCDRYGLMVADWIRDIPKKTKYPLTKKQEETLNFIKNHPNASLDEIRKGLRLKALSTVHEHVRVLAIKGYIKRLKGYKRTIIVL